MDGTPGRVGPFIRILTATSVMLASPTRLIAQATSSGSPLFQLHEEYVVAGLLALSVQLALIVALVVQRVRRRRAEEESRSHAERYRSVVDMKSELICRFLTDTTLTFVNDAYCRFWSKRREQLLGTKFIDLIPASARHAVLERIGQIARGTDSHEHPIVLRDGSIGWQHWIYHAILDDRGRIVEFQGAGHDITDRKRAEEAVGQLATRNSAMLRAIPDLMFVMSRDGTYVDYHAKDPKLLFVPPSTFMGKKVRDIMPAELADTFMDALEQASRNDDTVVVEYELPIDGRRHFEARLVQAGADRVLSMVRDVTESKRATQVIHDLGGRLIASQEIERERLARELHDNVSQKLALLKIGLDQVIGQLAGEPHRRLRQLSEQATEIADDVHDLSYQLHPSRLQTLGLVATVAALCSDVTQQAGIRVVFNYGILPPAIDPNVSLCLYRIVQEALHNITRHSRARDARVELEAENGGLILQIADSGAGFDPKDSGHDGLGLISMRERVATLRGELAIHTAPGSGTRIDVRVPLDDVDNERAMQQGSAVSRPASAELGRD